MTEAPTTEAETLPVGSRSIFELFAEAKRMVGPVGKDSINKQQGFNFRGIDAVVNAIAAAFDKLGIIPVPQLGRYEYNEGVEIGKARSLMGHVQVEVVYRFYGPRGDWFDAKVPGEAMDSGDKATAKAMSVAYRIALLQTLNLPTGEADPDSQSYQRSDARSGGRSGSEFDNAAPARPANGQQRPQQPQEPPPPPPLADGDLWGDAIADAATTDDCARIDQELRNEYLENKISGDRAGQIRYWIKQRAQTIRAAAAAASAEAGEAGEAASEPEGLTGAAKAEAEWVADFLASLVDVTDPDQLGAMRGQIGRAVADRIISPETGSTINGEINTRRNALRQDQSAEMAGVA
jgi:hypothetical protein